MSYDDVKKDFVKEKFFVVELDLDYCNLEYGVGACTALVGTTGPQKCFNTAKTCQDRVNYDKGTKTYRFCTKRSPVPAGLDAIPSLKGAPTFDAAKINPKGGLGVRGGVTLNFLDHPSADVGIDPYISERTYTPYDTGTYWGKLRARNPFYNNRAQRVFSGYLVDGIYDPLNFQQRTYVTESINSNRAGASVTGKDVLKLADNDRAQYPPKSTGVLVADIDSVVTSITLAPAGVGDAEYGTDGWVRIGDEVMSFTRIADVLTVIRGQYETVAIEHVENDSVQQCAYINDTVANVDYLVLTQGAKVDPAFIDLPIWQTESNDNYPYLLETLLTEPIGVQKLLKELGDNAPHFLYFDERLQKIIFTAVKAPPINVNVINDQEHVLPGLRVTDVPAARLSDVLIYFGQRDPTKKMDELNNYKQAYIRSDLASSDEDEYGSKKIQTIHSRWLNNFNKAQALIVAERIGRRFGITPRQVSFKMTSKDSDYWVGANVGIDHPSLQTATGETGDNIYQITSVKEAGDFEYSALEYLYTSPLPDDPDTGETIPLGGDDNNINLRDIYDLNSVSPPTGLTVVKFKIESSATIGSTSIVTYAIDTGSWPFGAVVTLQTDAGSFSVGKGGDATLGNPSEDGGGAIILNHDLTLINNGVIGGGGGSGGFGPTMGPPPRAGGGGAGFYIGIGSALVAGSNGTLELGGTGGTGGSAGGDGGSLGMNGVDSQGLAGNAGVAINKNGFVLTETLTGDIRGNIT